MNQPLLSVREMRLPDVALIADYWLQSETSFLENMGVDVNKIPSHEQLTVTLMQQLNIQVEQKKSYCIILEINGIAAGHCNTNPISFGEEAFMHLHLWNHQQRQKGVGVKLVALTLPYFFNNLQLKRLISEPYALNEAPNKALQKAGFLLVKEYKTVPGSLSFEQSVKRWEMSGERFSQLYEK